MHVCAHACRSTEWMHVHVRVDGVMSCHVLFHRHDEWHDVLHCDVMSCHVMLHVSVRMRINATPSSGKRKPHIWVKISEREMMSNNMYSSITHRSSSSSEASLFG